MTAKCEHCGASMPTHNNWNGLKRKFCTKRCAKASGHTRKFNRAAEKAPPAPTPESWWTNTETFYDEARKRFPYKADATLAFDRVSW